MKEQVHYSDVNVMQTSHETNKGAQNARTEEIVISFI